MLGFMPFDKTMKILITGANGLLGQKLVALLVQQPNVQVIATGKGSNRIPLKEGYSYHALDITDNVSVQHVFDSMQPDVLIHAAAMTNVDACELQQEACWLQNVEATRFLVSACKRVGTYMVHVSTDFIFDGTEGPLTEEAIPNPVNYYGESKWEAEKIVQTMGTNWSIARTVLVYGVVSDMSRTNIVLWAKDNLEQGKAIKVVDDQWRTPTLAEDLAMGCWLIAKHKAEGIYNISGEEMISPYDLAQKVGAVWGISTSSMQRADSSTFTQPAKRPPKTGFIITKAKEKLGFSPHSLQKGLELVKKQLDLVKQGVQF